MAATSPPGLVTHSVAPSGRVRASTGRRLATTTSSWPEAVADDEAADSSGEADEVSAGTDSPSEGDDGHTLSSAIAHPAGEGGRCQRPIHQLLPDEKECRTTARTRRSGQ